MDPGRPQRTGRRRDAVAYRSRTLCELVTDPRRSRRHQEHRACRRHGREDHGGCRGPALSRAHLPRRAARNHARNANVPQRRTRNGRWNSCARPPPTKASPASCSNASPTKSTQRSSRSRAIEAATSSRWRRTGGARSRVRCSEASRSACCPRPHARPSLALSETRVSAPIGVPLPLAAVRRNLTNSSRSRSSSVRRTCTRPGSIAARRAAPERSPAARCVRSRDQADGWRIPPAPRPA